MQIPSLPLILAVLLELYFIIPYSPNLYPVFKSTKCLYYTFSLLLELLIPIDSYLLNKDYCKSDYLLLCSFNSG